MVSNKNRLKGLTVCALCSAYLASCQAVTPQVETVPGSLTYGNRNVHLKRSPPGTVLTHDFRMSDGRLAQETYRLDENRRPQLLRREIISDWPD